jgi:Mannosyltransferase (PIG-V)
MSHPMAPAPVVVRPVPEGWYGVLRSTPVVAWTAHLVLVLTVAAATVAMTPDRDSKRPRFDGIAHYLVAPLAVWDGGWYVRIARHGYGRRQESAAFWPLYPLLLRLGHWLTGLPYDAVGVVLSNAAFLAALVALFALVRADYGLAIATRTVWLVALWPLSFFFSAVYTESLFLLLTVGALVLARGGRWTWAALAAALASLTRNSGILVLLPLGIMLLQQRGADPRGWWPRVVQLAAAAAAPLAFAVHLDRLWGDPLLMIHVEERWGRVRGTPWDTLLTAYDRTKHTYLTGLPSCDLRLDAGALDTCRAGLQITIDAFSDDLSFACVVGCLVLLPYALWRLRPRDSLYFAAGFVLPLFGPATYDPLLSAARYLIVLFPLYVALAHLLRRRPLFVAVLLGSTVALCGLLALFAQGYFVA